MSKSQLLLTVLLGVVCLAIIGFCIWSVVRGGPTELILGAAVVTLGLAQLVSFTARDSAISTALRRVSDMVSAYSALAREVHSVSRRLEVLESGDVARLTSHQRPEWTQHPVAAPPVRRSIGTTAHSAPAKSVDRVPPPPATNGSGNYSAPTPGSGKLEEEERFDLYLEPVVQIDDGSTRHYRASLSLRMADGTRVGMDTIQHQATRAGLMPMLDILTVTRAMAVLRRLMQRQRGVSIFCTASTAALADADFIARLNRLVADNQDVARGLVVDVGQPDFGKLSQLGANGIATLVEQGVTFCLSEADGQGADVGALRELGFRFVAMDIMTLANASTKQADDTVAAFVRSASLHNLKIIACNVATRTELAAITTRAALGFGPLFSPPRLVRHDITGQVASAAA
jgi:EAL domain-containing protein (putative c-di-GMP-specific phosphodiesterase class I)